MSSSRLGYQLVSPFHRLSTFTGKAVKLVEWILTNLKQPLWTEHCSHLGPWGLWYCVNRPQGRSLQQFISSIPYPNPNCIMNLFTSYVLHIQPMYILINLVWMYYMFEVISNSDKNIQYYMLTLSKTYCEIQTEYYWNLFKIYLCYI